MIHSIIYFFQSVHLNVQEAALLSSTSVESPDVNTSPGDHLDTTWWRKHGKTFGGKHLIRCSLPSESFCISGFLGVQEKHTLHYLDGQSLRNSTVLGPAEEQRSKNITQCVIFLRDLVVTSGYVHSPPKPFINVKVAKGINTCVCLSVRGFVL